MIGTSKEISSAAGLYIVSIGGKLLFFTDTTINIDMNAEKLAHIAVQAAQFAESMGVVPRIAFLSYSSFGSVDHPSAHMSTAAKEYVEKLAPNYQVEGEMQADIAVDFETLKQHYPFTSLDGPANVLVFPDMQSGNIAYKLLQRLGKAQVIGPIILGIDKPAYVMQRHSGVDEIFNMITVAVARSAL